MAMCAAGRASGWCPYCYEGVRGRRTHRGHFGWRAPRIIRYQPWELDPVKRPDPLPVGATAPEPEDKKFLRDYPTLFAYLTDERWEDGKARERSTVTLVIEGGLFRACINDRALSRSLWRSGPSLAECLTAIEKALAGPGGDWRAFKGRK